MSGCSLACLLRRWSYPDVSSCAQAVRPRGGFRVGEKFVLAIKIPAGGGPGVKVPKGSGRCCIGRDPGPHPNQYFTDRSPYPTTVQ